MNSRQTEALTASIHELASAVQNLTKQIEPKTEPHPLDDMSNEEIAIILVSRGKVESKKQIAEILNLSHGTVRNWSKLRVAMDAFKRGEKLGRLNYPK